ncbi:MAG: hypothetical protein AAB339_08580, partial [Elusimicrobiota bacterium]
MATKTASKKTDLSQTRGNGYERLKPSEARKLDDACRAYIAFLSVSKTEREAHDEAVRLLQAQGFKDLEPMIASDKR